MFKQKSDYRVDDSIQTRCSNIFADLLLVTCYFERQFFFLTTHRFLVHTQKKTTQTITDQKAVLISEHFDKAEHGRKRKISGYSCMHIKDIFYFNQEELLLRVFFQKNLVVPI